MYFSLAAHNHLYDKIGDNWRSISSLDSWLKFQLNWIICNTLSLTLSHVFITNDICIRYITDYADNVLEACLDCNGYLPPT